MEEVHWARYDGQVCIVSMPSMNTPPSLHLQVFTNPDALWIPLFKGIYGGLIKMWLSKLLFLSDQFNLLAFPLPRGQQSEAQSSKLLIKA